MNPVLRAKAMLVDPFAEWARIERESGDPAFLLSRYVAVLALVPALFGFVGACFIGAITPDAGLMHASWFDGAFGAIFLYVESFVAVLVLGFIIDIVAPLFGGRKDFDAALKLAVYSLTPVWLAGFFLLMPGLRFLVLTAFYGSYVLATGLPRLMKTPKAQSPLYITLATACAFGLIVGAVFAQRAIFPVSGI
jgi:Yip1 domain